MCTNKVTQSDVTRTKLLSAKLAQGSKIDDDRRLRNSKVDATE